MEAQRTDATVGELVAALARDTGTLVRHEVRLASTEMMRKARTSVRHVAVVAVGGAVLYAGLLALLGAAVIALALVLPGWMAALAVGLVAIGVGYALVQRGLTLLERVELTPKETVKTLEQNVAWAKEQLR